MYKNGKSILIIDDEVLALSYLKDMLEECIKKYPSLADYEVFATNSYSTFMSILSSNLPNIVFLDVQMPKKNGLEIAQEIRAKYQELGYPNDKMPIIIFATAYENYGYQAFKVGAYDYLLKPIEEDDIHDVLNSLVSDYSLLNQKKEEKITVNSNGIHIDIPLSNVIYFKAEMKYVAVVTDKKEFLINDTLINLEEKYSSFIKIHRAYLVNPMCIQKIIKEDSQISIMLKNIGTILPVSRRQKPELEKKIEYKHLSGE